MKRTGKPSPYRRPVARTRSVGQLQVPERLYETVHRRVTDIAPILVPGYLYMPDELCGSAFVAALPPAQRALVSLCLADMAERGVLPLVVAWVAKGAALRFVVQEGAR
jgi:hypothetical protein